MPAPTLLVARFVRMLAFRGANPVFHFHGWGALLLGLLTGSLAAATPLVSIDATTYQTEHCLFVIDASVNWASPSGAYSDLFGTAPFTRLNASFDKLTTVFPASYFSICYMANTGDSHVPNYIDRIYKATGISTGVGSAGLGSTGAPGAPQSFATVDFCRYNQTGNISATILAVYDHELGHAWGAQFFNNVSGVGPGILSNGHWLSNTTIDCQLGATYSPDGGVTVDKLYGDPTHGFRYQPVDNLRSNDVATFSEQQLYLMGLREVFPTTYALNSPVYHADLTMGSATVETYDHAAAVARYGVRNPDYKTSPKQFKLGFVYIARDLAEVNSVYQVVEQSVVQFCSGEALDPVAYRFQTPFLVDTHFRASVDGRLADLDGTATPAFAVTDTYTLSADGSASVNFIATDPAGPVPTVSVLPASTQCTVTGSVVHVTGLPDGVHFFTLKAVNAAGKKAFGHFVVEVQRPVTSTLISTQPLTQTVTAGAAAAFSVAATGTPAAFSYQWFRRSARTSTWNSLTDSGGYSGSGTATLAVVSSTDMNGDQFICTAANATGLATSLPAALVVNESAPAVTTQPVDRAVSTGSAAHFTVAVTGVPLTYGYSYYQWQRQVAGSGPWIDLVTVAGINGPATASLTVSGTTLVMSGDQFRCLVTNTAGSTTSSVATLTVNQPPTITTQPQNVTAAAGATVSFTVAATSTAPLTYQWSKYSTPIPGATSATLTLVNISAADAAAYVVAITNVAGTTGSNAASLTVTGSTAPAITTQPQSQSVAVGSPTSFSVAATGTAPLTYQWSKGGTPIAGATSSTYALASSQLSDAGNYFVTVSNSAGGAISSTAILTVTAAPPSITTQPQGASVLTGASVTFTVTVSGTAPFTYQWQKSGVPLAGVTAASYALASTQLTDAGNYTVTITNSAGSTTSVPAVLTVAVAPSAPSIATQPQGASVNVGATASFSVTAAGTAPLTYQWQKNGSSLASATSSTYVIASAQASDAGSYSVVVSNAVGSVTSSAVPLTVTVIAPTISTPPQGASVTAGSAVSFSVAATGTTPFAYQWSRHGSPIGGATLASYPIASAQAADAGDYTVTVSNGAGFVTSTAATLTVTALALAPVLTMPPQGAAVTIGTGVTFSVTASGTAPFTYQWLQNGVILSGATSSSYLLASAQSTDAGNYTVTVTNSAGSAASAAAVLLVSAAPPVITTPPQNASVLSGSSASFSVAVTGTPPFTYQWLKNGTPLAGGTSPGYMIAGAQAADSGNFSVTVTNAAGTVTSANAALTVAAVATAPAITAQPVSATVNAGASISFTVTVSGTAPFSYQWSKNGAALSGATAAVYTLASAQPADTGTYSVTVSNSAGFVTSAVATLTVSAAPPVITSQPQGAVTVAGASATFTVATGGTLPFNFQWYREGAAIPGANSPGYTINPVTGAQGGSYTVTITNAAGSVNSQPVTLTVLTAGAVPASVLANLSVRTTLASGQQLIPGFVTNGPKSILLRVAGPTLNALGLGLSGYPDPLLQVFNSSSQKIAENNDWDPALGATFTQVGAFPFIPGGKDAALLASVTGPTSAIAAGNGSGTVLMELYDLQTDYANRLVNVSARNQVGEGADALIVGFVITGTGSKQLLIRGVGPTLAHYGVTGFLADPKLELYAADGTQLTENDNWSSSLTGTFAQVGAFALDAGSKDAALLISLSAGVYSVKLTGLNHGTGEGLVEVYEVWP
jgi:hypothetical protein